MKGVVITGATSMLGVALIKECLKNQIKVLAIVRRDSTNLYRIPNSKDIKVIECNLDELSEIEGSKESYQVFYHFGWDYTGRQNRNNAALQYLNIKYTLDAVELANRYGCTSFIGAGSQAEYGRVQNVITPDNAVNPEIAYGIAKYAAGKLSLLQCAAIGMQCIWTRIFSVYGPYDNKDTMIMYSIQKLMAHEKHSYTKSEQLWDYLYCDDAERAFYLIGLQGKDKSIYCIGSGKVKHLSEYIDQIRNNIDPKLEVGIGENDYSEQQVMHLCADISNLIADTGFQPLISFEEGIKRTIEWFTMEKKRELPIEL